MKRVTSIARQKNLAMRVYKCGRDKIWLDPEEIQIIATAKSRQDIRDLVKDGIIKRKLRPGQPMNREVKLRRRRHLRAQRARASARPVKEAIVDAESSVITPDATSTPRKKRTRRDYINRKIEESKQKRAERRQAAKATASEQKEQNSPPERTTPHPATLSDPIIESKESS
eukprot:TRINITY_DN2646_c0_g1_i1.p1 TRINITY_DN2646_c0_g1~~TRINITY_DN2646_c0_g1_i1.p1  ORF type:complete len:180 (-),score=40.96 TRINITY_DN2646_c0_g1_i1:36-548(-)